MVHSSLQLQPYKSTAGVPVNLGRAGPRWRPSLVARLAESLRTEDGAGAPVSPRTWSLFLSWAAVLRQSHGRFQAAILGSPVGRPGISTSYLDRDHDVVAGVGGPDVGRMSDISQKVPRSTVCNHNVYVSCFNKSNIRVYSVRK